jgi:hypothetical protein
MLKTWRTLLILLSTVNERNRRRPNGRCTNKGSAEPPVDNVFLWRDNCKIRNLEILIFCNRGINLGKSRNPGMLLFPFGNLSHTSILYYIISYVTEAFEWYGVGHPRFLAKDSNCNILRYPYHSTHKTIDRTYCIPGVSSLSQSLQAHEP